MGRGEVSRKRLCHHLVTMKVFWFLFHCGFFQDSCIVQYVHMVDSVAQPSEKGTKALSRFRLSSWSRFQSVTGPKPIPCRKVTVEVMDSASPPPPPRSASGSSAEGR